MTDQNRNKPGNKENTRKDEQLQNNKKPHDEGRRSKETDQYNEKETEKADR